MPGIGVKQEDIDQFVAITQASPEDAQHFLNAGTTLEGAIEDFYAAQNAAGTGTTESSSLLNPSSSNENNQDIMSDQQHEQAQPHQNPPATGGPRTLGGQSADTALPAGWGQPKKQFGRIGDWSDEQSGQASRSTPRWPSGPGEGEEEDDDDDESRRGETTFAGGERSGLAIQQPDGPGSGRGHRGIVENILRQAAENSKEQSTSVPSASNPFRGAGNVLGDDETPSSTINQPQPAPAAGGGPSSLLQSLLSGFGGGNAQQGQDEEEDDEEEITKRLTFWKDGFSIEDGPLLRYDEPGNKDLLEAIQSGRAPPSLFGVRFNQPIRIEVAQRTNETYTPPPKVLKPFEGGGNRLGSATPEIRSSTPTMPGSILQGSSSTTTSSTSNQPPISEAKFEVDNSKPTTSIQVRLGDGTKLVAKVNLTHTVGDLRNFVSAPDNRPFVLQTTFPSKELSDFNQTIEGANLKNAVVVQRFT